MKNTGRGKTGAASAPPRPRITRTFTFRGAEQSEVLQAAGVCIAERNYGTIVSLVWHGDVAPESKPSLWQLEMTVEAPQ